MRTLLALGLVVSLVCLAPILRAIHDMPARTQRGDSLSITARASSRTGHTCRIESGSSPAIQQTLPDAALLLQTIEAESDPDRRSEALDRATESVADADLRNVLDSLLTMGGAAAGELRPLLTRRWAEKDPAAAATWASQLVEGPVRCELLEQVALAWTDGDASSAVSWLRGLPEGESKQHAMLGAAREIAAAEPVTAIELLSPLPPTTGRDQAMIHAVSQWAVGDFSAAAKWAEGVADADLRRELVAAVAAASAEKDPVGAVTLIVNALDRGEAQNRAAVAVVQRWAQVSARDAAAWVLEFPAGPTQNAAAENLVRIWKAQNAGDAAKWLSELPEGPLRNAGLSGYDETLRTASPER